MKRLSRLYVAGILLWLVLPLHAQTVCPQQTFADWTKWAVTIDPAQIAVDPNTLKPCALGLIYVHPGKAWAINGKICDPDGDTMTLTASAGTLTVRTDNTYTVSGTALGVGLIYVTMTLMDHPVIPEDSITRKGTWVIAVIPRNRPPVLY